MYFWKKWRDPESEREWNGERNNVGKWKRSYRPVYRQLDEDDYEIIGYIED